MKAPMYVEKNLGMERYRERCQRILNNQINEIQKRKFKLASTDIDDGFKKLTESRIRAHQFSLSGMLISYKFS